jgi:hypothetical protein
MQETGKTAKSIFGSRPQPGLDAVGAWQTAHPLSISKGWICRARLKLGRVP